MRERIEWYLKRGISKGRYQELKAISLQYDDYKRAAARYARGETDRTPGSGAWSPKDPVANEAIRLAMGCKEGARANAIEQAAVAADITLCGYILRNVTRGETYERIGPPCGRRQFFDARRRYFAELHERV